MIIKSILAKRVRSSLNNGWARMRLNLWGRTERQGKCSHRPLRPSPSLSPPPERHYSGRSFLPSLDIIQCNHPSIKNLLIIKGTTRVNTRNMEKDDRVVGDIVYKWASLSKPIAAWCLNRNSTVAGVIITVTFCIIACLRSVNLRKNDGYINESMG